MSKAFPRKPFYGLAEICTRWSLQEADIAAYVLAGELTLSIPVAGVRVETYEDDEDSDGRSFRIPTGTRWIVGTMDLGRVDAWSVLQHASQAVGQFYGATPGESFDLPDQNDQPGTLLVDRQALVLRHAEMERFEGVQGIGAGDPVASDGPEGPGRKRSRGAPPKYDWESFWVEIINTIWADGAPRTQAELMQRMLDWFATELGPDDVPCESSIKLRLSRIWPTIKPDIGRPSALSAVKSATAQHSPGKARATSR
jgi:hypothetical protein